MYYYKVIDKKAPRFRRSKYRDNFMNRELHEKFCKKHNIDIEYDLFVKVFNTSSEEIVNTVVNDRDGIRLYKTMGRLQMVMFLLDKYEDIKNYNEHLYLDKELFIPKQMGKILWTFKDVKYKFKNSHLYGFDAHRSFKNAASKAFRETPERFKQISIRFKKEMYERIKRINNEFKLERSNQPDQDTK